jgi:uncharacterized protein YecT (DUF1311 family)
MFITILALASMQAASPANATVPCGPESTTVEMAGCAEAELRDADERLNTRWQSALFTAQRHDREFGAENRRSGARPTIETLRAAQRAWIVYRDAHCATDASYSNAGTARSLALLSCLRTTTIARTQELAALTDIM